MKVINHIGLSSGKDSTALWGWAINESGYDPATIRGSFCDTENEYDDVYDQIRILDAYGQRHGIAPVRTLRSMGFLGLVLWKQRFPGAKSRFCTEQLKMIPSKYYIQELQLEGFDVLSHSGVRRDESDERSVLEENGFSEWLQCPVRRPLLDWKLDDVWAVHKRYGLPINTLYNTGRKRVGCKLCCMSNKEDIRITAKTRPETIDTYREWERIATEQAGGKGHYKSFFPADKVPLVQRSETFISRKTGEIHKVCTIDDAVRWSFTLHGGTQGGFDFMFQEDDANEPCKMGYCE